MSRTRKPAVRFTLAGVVYEVGYNMPKGRLDQEVLCVALREDALLHLSHPHGIRIHRSAGLSVARVNDVEQPIQFSAPLEASSAVID